MTLPVEPIEPVEEIIAELVDSDKPILNSRLVELSNLDAEELKLFEQMWVAIEARRRQEIMNRLVELAEYNAKLDFESIFKSRLGDEDARVRAKAIEGLWESEDTSIIDSLLHLLGQDGSEEVQVAAATTLGKVVMLAELDKLRSSYKSRIEGVLLDIVGDNNRPLELRCRALEAVAPLSVPEVKKAIEEAYASTEIKFRTSAVYAMGRNCDPSWLPVLLTELASISPEMRCEASVACGELGEIEAVPRLIELTDDIDVEVQTAAIQALGKIGGSEAEECLEECLESSNEAVRQAAEDAINKREISEDPFSFKFETGME